MDVTGEGSSSLVCGRSACFGTCDDDGGKGGGDSKVSCLSRFPLASFCFSRCCCCCCCCFMVDKFVCDLPNILPNFERVPGLDESPIAGVIRVCRISGFVLANSKFVSCYCSCSFINFFFFLINK